MSGKHVLRSDDLESTVLVLLPAGPDRVEVKAAPDGLLMSSDTAGPVYGRAQAMPPR